MNQIAIGTFFATRNPAPLSADDRRVVREFHVLYYRRWVQNLSDTANLSWFGHCLIKFPGDLWTYQELLVRTKPDVVVETGTYNGGSALYLAMIMDALGHGRVITIDIEDKADRPEHPRITYLTGSSVDPEIVADIFKQVGSERAMVILDSDHSEHHVSEELAAYSPLVQVGDYLIVEDTNVGGYPVISHFGPGPMEAVVKFLAGDETFVVDRNCERFLMTQNPSGYLKRVKPS